MEIRKTINIKKDGKYIVCYNLPSLQSIMGSTSVSGNLGYYKVEKRGNSFYVPIDVVKARVEELELRVGALLEKLDVMRQVLK